MSTSDSPKARRKYKRSGDSMYRPSEDSKVPKKPKPSGHPKRPSNAYFLYVKNNRALTKEANPELTFGEIGRKMSEDWKNNLSAEDKKRYEDEAKAEQEAYAAAMIKYKKSHKYKRYLRDLEEWNELYKEEWKLQEYEKQMEKENKKKEGKDKKKKDQKKASKRSKK